MSRVPHPLIADDGSIDLDILGDRWSPALTLSKVLTAMQSVLANPTAADVLRHGCIRNADWELGAFSTASQDVSVLLNLLLKAAQPPSGPYSPDFWFSWRFLAGLRSLLRMHPSVYAASSRDWYALLQSLSNMPALKS